MKTQKTNLDHVYIGIDNGGIKFEIDRLQFKYGENKEKRKALPVLSISSSHFGHQTNGMKIQITPSRMKQMGQWLIDCADKSEMWYSNENEGENVFDGVHSKFRISPSEGTWDEEVVFKKVSKIYDENKFPLDKKLIILTGNKGVTLADFDGKELRDYEGNTLVQGIIAKYWAPHPHF